MTINYFQALIVIAVCFTLHSGRVMYIEQKHEIAMAGQAAQLKARCKAEKAITEEIDNDLQNKTDGLDAGFNELVRMQRKFFDVVTDTAARNDATPQDARLPRQNGRLALLTFARDAEEVGLRLDACQSFIKKTWALADAAK